MRFKNYRHLNVLIVPALVFSCSVLLSLVVLRYGMKPAWETMKNNKNAVAAFSNSFSSENGYGSIKNRLISDRDSLKLKYHDLMRDNGGPKDLPGVLQTIIAKANAADIKFVKMQPQTESKTGVPINYTMVLELTASYNSYCRFIAALESLPSMVRIDRIALSDPKNNMLEIRTLVTCFIQPKTNH